MKPFKVSNRLDILVEPALSGSESEPMLGESLECVEEVDEEDEVMQENIQTFISMGLLQIQSDFQPLTSKKAAFKDSSKKLLLLDMDETLLHAATLEDIYNNKVYGENAVPSFTTTFVDNNLVIKIGVFLRPYLQEMLQRLLPLFDLCVYTASERVYADAIINKIDPHNKFFVKRLYRDKCTKAMLDGGRVVYLKDLRCISGYKL